VRVAILSSGQTATNTHFYSNKKLSSALALLCLGATIKVEIPSVGS
jgi:hypothetical protein